MEDTVPNRRVYKDEASKVVIENFTENNYATYAVFVNRIDEDDDDCDYPSGIFTTYVYNITNSGNSVITIKQGFSNQGIETFISERKIDSITFRNKLRYDLLTYENVLHNRGERNVKEKLQNYIKGYRMPICDIISRLIIELPRPITLQDLTDEVIDNHDYSEERIEEWINY